MFMCLHHFAHLGCKVQTESNLRKVPEFLVATSPPSGKTAAAVRFSAITALASALRRHLLPKGALLRLVNDGTLLPLLTQEMDEDW